MATITQLSSGRFRVQFRVKGFKLISRTFSVKPDADKYQARIEQEIASIREAEKAKLPVDMAALYQSLHPDLQQSAQLYPSFTRILGTSMGNSLNLTQLIDRFMREYDKKDQNIIRRLKWWSDHYGHLKISELSEDHIRHGVNNLLRYGMTGKKGISGQTTNRFKANLSSVFEFGKTHYHLKTNPCRLIKGKSEGKGRKRYLSQNEQKKLIEAAKRSKWDKFYLLILMALTTGARRGELRKLRWCDIEWNKNQACCKNTKNGSDKILHLTSYVIDELKKHRSIGSGLIFSHPKNSLKPYFFHDEWIQALHLAGIPLLNEEGEKLVFHSLRHTFCSTLANTGAELHEIASLAGHKSIQTTMRYTHLNDNKLSSVVNETFSRLSTTNS